MRLSVLALAVALTACVAPQQQSVTSTNLIAADAATSLAVGTQISEQRTAIASENDDPVVNLTLRHADGRTLAFQEANHAPNDVFVQSAGGALAQIMGLTGNEAPTLFHAAESGGAVGGAPFFCGPQGPLAIGRYEAPDHTVRIVGLREGIQVETRPDGQMEAVPYSPSLVCARLTFRKG
jgi:hypothetical protein